MKQIFLAILAVTLLSSNADARVIPFEPFHGRLSPQRYTPTFSDEEYFLTGSEFQQQKLYYRALLCFGMIVHHFPSSTHYAEALYQISLCYAHQGAPDLACKYLDRYLEHPKAVYSDDVVELQYRIANQFADGSRKRLFGYEGFPKLLKANTDAIRLYDQILTARPYGEMGALALFNKGRLLISMKQPAEGLKILKKVTQQFPRHAVSLQAYDLMVSTYHAQAMQEPQNPVYLSLAEACLQACKKQYPHNPSNTEIAKHVQNIKELHAKELYQMGKFYERKKKRNAARIYYTSAISHFPETKFSQKSQKRLNRINAKMT